MRRSIVSGFTLFIALACVAALATPVPPHYGATPVESVRSIFRISDLHASVHVRSSMVFENVAIVVVHGTPMDQGDSRGADRGAPLLLQRFSFGWQPVAVVQAPCDLDGRGITAREKAKILASIHLETTSTVDCGDRDRGSADDIVAVRRQMYGPVVPFVIVSGGYAFAPEYGDGGGCGLFRKVGRKWEQIGGCKGALTPGVVERYHIPFGTQCALGIAEAGCAGNRSAGHP
jgi:hypothetical protein